MMSVIFILLVEFRLRNVPDVPLISNSKIISSSPRIAVTFDFLTILRNAGNGGSMKSQFSEISRKCVYFSEPNGA